MAWLFNLGAPESLGSRPTFNSTTRAIPSAQRKYAAGELVGQLDVFAGTYPNPTAQAAWYTILFRSVNNGQFFPTSGELIYTSTHELGHVFDGTHSPQPSSTVTYDTAVQNDWLKLDWVNFAM